MGHLVTAVLMTYTLIDCLSVHFIILNRNEEIIHSAAEICTFQYPKYTTCFDFFITPASGMNIKVITSNILVKQV